MSDKEPVVRKSWLVGLLILAVAFALLLLAIMPVSSRDEAGGEAVTMTIRFREGVGPDVMQAFFDGFNAGSSRSSPSTFSLSVPGRSITATYSDARKAEPVVFWAEKSASVEEVAVETAG